MTPQEYASSIFVPLFYGRRRSHDIVGHGEDIRLADALKVAQPEKHTEPVDVVHALYVQERDIFSHRILTMKPQPCARLVVVAIGDTVIGIGIDAKETYHGLANLEGCRRGERCSFGVCRREGDRPCITIDDIGDGVGCGRGGQCLCCRAATVGGNDLDTCRVSSRIPRDIGIISAHLVGLRHCHSRDASCSRAGVVHHDAFGVIGAVGFLQHIGVYFVGLNRGMPVLAAAAYLACIDRRADVASPAH